MQQWGSIAELVSAGATVAALVAASIATWQAFRTNNQQGRQLAALEQSERDRTEQAVRADANRVAFWPGFRPDDPRSAFVYYANTSGLPVYELTLRIAVPLREDPILVRYEALGPEPHHRPLRRTRRELDAYAREHGPVAWGDLLGGRQLRCSATFRDTSGRWWVRDERGALLGPWGSGDEATRAESDASSTA